MSTTSTLYAYRETGSGPATLFSGVWNETELAPASSTPLPVHKQPPYQHFDYPPCREVKRAVDDMFSIPVHPALLEDDRARVAQAIATL